MNITSHDGLQLELLTNALDSARPTVVFINALGVDNAICESLAAALDKQGYNFVTWSRRGFPGAYDERFRTFSVQDQVDDLHSIVEALALPSYILTAWCTGIQIALVAAAQLAQQQRLNQVQRMVFFNAPNFFAQGEQGLTGDTIGLVSRMLVADENKLDFFYNNIVAHNNQAVQDRLARVDNRYYQQLIQAPFTSGKDAFLRFAHLVTTTHKFKIDSSVTEHITTPTMVVGGKLDDMVAWQESVALADLLPNAQHHIFDEWGHYNLFTDADSVSQQFITKS